MKMRLRNSLFFFVFILAAFFLPAVVFGDEIGSSKSFYIDSNYSSSSNNQAEGKLLLSTNRLYFYIENNYWESKEDEEKKEIEKFLQGLDDEFNRKIYPGITAAFGVEMYSGINKDPKITLFFHPTKSGVNGYIRNVDAYEKVVAPSSNERKMIYMSTDFKWTKETLAHELVHLITLSKKDLRHNVREDTWLNEARAEYAITLLGYNEGSNSYINSRISSFLERPYTSLTNWNSSNYDYAIINSFIHYLVDHYGLSVLSGSLNSKKVGVESIEDALTNSGHRDSFADIFTNWAIASYINDCGAGSKYCFKNERLSSVLVIPFANFLPFSGDNTLYTGQTLSNYSAHWQRYAGGKGDLTIKFVNPSKKAMKVPYIIKKTSGENVVRFIDLNQNQEGELVVTGIGSTVGYVTVIPVLADSTIDNQSYFYSLTAQTFVRENQGNNVNIDLPFELDKPLNQMNREELLMVIIRTIIYLLVQGKLVI